MMDAKGRSRLVVLSTTLSLSLGCSGILSSVGGSGVLSREPREHVYFREDGTCEHDADIDCPPPEEATCNPPPPLPTPCPPTRITSIQRDEAGVCHQEARVTECPPATDCGAVPTRTVDCPPVLTAAGTLQKQHSYGCVIWTPGRGEPVACPAELDAPPSDAYDYTPLGEGLCRAFLRDSGHCPPGASCNPPPPEEVLCPPGVGEGE